MTVELAPEQIGAQREHFPGPLATWALASIAAGNTAGRLWAVGGAAEPTLLLWDQGNNVFYLAGAPPDDGAEADLKGLVAAVIRPAAVAQGLTRFKVRGAAPGLEKALPRLFGVALHKTHSAVYLLGDGEPPPARTPAVAGLRLAPIDRALLAQAELGGREELLAEIGWMWPDVDRFYREGFGVAAVLVGALAGWCTAEYVSPGRCGVGIATVPAYEGRGVATAMAARFVQECRSRGVAPLWETASTNGASRRVAEKAGFTLADEGQAWLGSFGPDQK